ncbi:2-isopropylmalate synthase [Alphaproteobacteria bacterium]|nr:2-isopropylmalate synthase [Alphaproteobacteria bacterium]
MVTMPFEKYRPVERIPLKNRQWPDKTIAKAPIWCSVDLRDGNQALIEPMSPEEKRRMFIHLVKMGFKEIEVGFPSASDTDYAFLRMLIDDGLIPADVTIQVLTQAREHLIRKTFESIKGTPRAIIHLYNSTSELQRRVVFGASREEVIEIAVNGARLISDIARDFSGSRIMYEYSPESFSGTEPDFVVDIVEAVMDVFKPAPDNRLIVNLPSTVEVCTPNHYADQIEYFCSHVKNRDSLIVSIHPHNDRGTGVASGELALLAGGERIEGTLFGNGERTGNVDIIAMAMNMMTQGVDPKLDVSNIDELVGLSNDCTRIPIHPRHPYAGDLVFTAFSGSHQDAIKKGLAALAKNGGNVWEVPYLPIDPADLGRSYEAVIRINSQSGKGGVAYILERDHGLKLPRTMQAEFSRVVQKNADITGKEQSAKEIYAAFETEYLKRVAPYRILGHRFENEGDICISTTKIRAPEGEKIIVGRGNGPIDAFTNALRGEGINVQLADYSEHAIGRGADARAVAYVEIVSNDGPVCGAGMHEDIVVASLSALISAVNRRGAKP